MPKIGSLDVEFSGDGQWLTTRILVLSVGKPGHGKRHSSFPGTQSRFTPDGKVLAVESGGASFTCMNQGLAGSWRDWKIQIKIRAIGLSLALMGPNSLLSDVKPIRFMPGIFEDSQPTRPNGAGLGYAFLSARRTGMGHRSFADGSEIVSHTGAYRTGTLILGPRYLSPFSANVSFTAWTERLARTEDHPLLQRIPNPKPCDASEGPEAFPSFARKMSQRSSCHGKLLSSRQQAN